MTMSSVCVKCSQSTVTTSDFDDTLLELNNLPCLNSYNIITIEYPPFI